MEEPLEIRVSGEALAVLMRTPGDDRALVAGFLLTEGVIDGLDDVIAIEPCRDPNMVNAQNIVRVSLAAGSPLSQSRLARARREMFTGSSCGLCGKATIESIHQDVKPHADFLELNAAAIRSMSGQARLRQAGFSATGGLHAAAMFDAGGRLDRVAEDIGRHNAVDKVLGAALLAEQLVEDAILWVSGRASFEVTQKALVGGMRALVSVGAPSSLAVDMAYASGLTLVGFVRDDRFNVYAGTVK